MKITTKIPQIICLSLVAAGLAFNVVSCKKDSSTSASASTTITEADVVELTTDAINPANGGMVTQVNTSVIIYKTANLSCGVTKDSTFTIASVSGASPSFSYALSTNALLACDGLVPNQLTFNFTSAGNFNGPRMSSNDKSTGGFVLTGLGSSASQYLLSTTYSRSGSTTSKIGNQNTFTSSLAIKSTNMVVDKLTMQIVSGTATVTLNAASTSGKTFTFNGTLTFLGSNSAKLVLNSGTSYNIQWI